ncbi:hypothetical protein Q4519_06920 [Motilimonas sp. 1_MG-2023]|uniref:hypothetical protein n=1 Tax=Motilimonas sp. 1_MG-2023 TaxID=3062672 RepID=UPI0026E130C6|nr:hypothetical protein [Motilimonas sp. 1_MG-2023]MDO6525413.1 hypothetical protein [Motilimonas sp. 1_MG-2023]
MAKPYYISNHAVRRYSERRCKPAFHIKADIRHARPVTKNRMRKLGKKTKSGRHMLVTPDNFAFVACGQVIVTCFQLGDEHEFSEH